MYTIQKFSLNFLNSEEAFWHVEGLVVPGETGKPSIENGI
jgi:hypothetical protein